MNAPMHTAATASQNALGRRRMTSGRLGSTTRRCHPTGLGSSSVSTFELWRPPTEKDNRYLLY